MASEEKGQMKEGETYPLILLYEPILPGHMSIYVTVLNIIQCIALAFILNEFNLIITGQKEFVWILPLRSAIALLIILVIWHSYVTESFYLWPIGWADTIIPFFIGIAECMVVFFVKPDAQKNNITFGFFVLFISFVQILGAMAYYNALYKRNNKETQKLYRSVYSMVPNFSENLLKILNDFDSKNIIVLLVCALVSFVFACLAVQYKSFLEIVFFLIFITEIIIWKAMLDLPRFLRKDKQVGPYFSEKEAVR
ncbi:MAG: hypothetical protein AAB361_01145 [Patescibacteria group bacterium]